MAKIKNRALYIGFDKLINIPKEYAEKEYDESQLCKAFGRTLKILREHKKLTLRQLSDEIQIPPQTINRYENGDNIPTIIQALKIADYFYLSIELFIAFGIHVIEENTDITVLYDKLQNAFEQAGKKA